MALIGKIFKINLGSPLDSCRTARPKWRILKLLPFDVCVSAGTPVVYPLEFNYPHETVCKMSASSKRPGWLVQRNSWKWQVERGSISNTTFFKNPSKKFRWVEYLQECHSSLHFLSHLPSCPSTFTAVFFYLTSRWRYGQKCNVTFLRLQVKHNRTL